MPIFTCPRCRKPADERFYGPCSTCVVELVALQPPTPDPNYVEATLSNGLPTTNYIGPRVDRQADACPEVFGGQLVQLRTGYRMLDVETKGRV